ncbi:MAG TPA: PilT/PilU family type 4a pilus ATPase [Thermoanaerobaculia bacterium]|nr:PilT/PilU family type 4a pilus ATPase [Thermoanaerobaculia bacterium]
MDTDELNKLIRSLNEGATSDRQEAAGPDLELVRSEEPAAGLELAAKTPPTGEDELPPGLVALLSETVRRGATDLLLVPGASPVVRVHGALEKAGGDAVSSQTAFDLLSPSLSGDRRRRYHETGVVDLSLKIAGLGRFRVNLHRTRRGVGAALRVLPKRVPSLSELGLPEMLYDLTKAARGLILVTGATGSGKTTTLAALVDRMNRTEKRHIVTIEDPVEYEHAHAKSLVEQVEVGVDVSSFATALVAALRQDPDVILVGEMRDLETTRAAVTAAETGHLVLTTLHTNDVPQTINRILDIFPPEQQGQVRHQLSLALSAIVCQQLVPRKDGSGRALAVEILVATDSIRAHIRRGSFHQIHTELTLGKRFGMTAMEDSLAALVAAGTISEAEARLRASHPDDLASRLAGGRPSV